MTNIKSFIFFPFQINYNNDEGENDNGSADDGGENDDFISSNELLNNSIEYTQTSCEFVCLCMQCIYTA